MTDLATIPPPLLWWLIARSQADAQSADAPPSGTVTFPATDLTFRIRLGVGAGYAVPADLSADPGTWNWLDITEYVRYDLGVTTRTGKVDESDVVTPGRMQLKLDNSAKPGTTYPEAGRFTRRNPYSSLFGLLTKNTPIWVEVNPGSGFVTLAQMFVNEWPTRWTDKSATDSTVTIACAGILRRLGQGSIARSALRRTLLGANAAAQPVAYWPLEDGPTATTLAEMINPGQLGRIVHSETYPGTSKPLTGVAVLRGLSRPDPTGNNDEEGASVILPVAEYADTGTVVVTLFHRWDPFNDPISPVGATDVFLDHRVDFFDGDLRRARFIFQSTTASTVGVAVYLKNSIGDLLLAGGSLSSTVDPEDGAWHEIQLRLTTSGSDIAAELWIDGALADSDTAAAVTMGRAAQIVFGCSGHYNSDPDLVTADQAPYEVGHVSVHTSDVVGSLYEAGIGYAGEQAHARIARLFAEDGVRYTSGAGESPTMGEQSFISTLPLVREAEAVDQGVLYEGDWGVRYLSHRERENAPVSIALDFDSGHIAELPEPADDDQRTRNRWTISRTDGSEFTHEETTGPMGTGSQGPGLYDDSDRVNVEADEQLSDQASYRVVVGTVDEDRWPSIDLNFAASPDLIDAFTSMPFGARVTISNPPAEMPPDVIDVTVEGISQSLNPKQWRATLHTSPFAPHRTFRLAETAGDQDDFLGYLVPDWCYLAEDLDTTETAVDINSEPAWSQDADDWTPGALIVIGGEHMLVTGVSGSSNPQTLTVTRSSNGVVKSHSVGAEVQFVHPGFLGL